MTANNTTGIWIDGLHFGNLYLPCIFEFRITAFFTSIIGIQGITNSFKRLNAYNQGDFHQSIPSTASCQLADAYRSFSNTKYYQYCDIQVMPASPT